MTRSLPRLRRLAPALLLLALVGGGCSAGAGGDGGGGSEAAAEGEAVADEAAPEAGAARTLSGGGADLAERGGEASNTATGPAAVRQRAVISTGTVSLRERDLESTLLEVRKVIDAHRGEIAERESDTDDDGRLYTARLVVRVPAGQFDEAMDRLAALSEHAATTQTTEDVTTQVIDIAARVRAQTASLERMETLLGRAEDLRDIVAIETQLTRRQADLDSLKSQQAWLADQTALATITVYLEQRGDREPEEDPSGFLAGLAAGWRGLGQAFAATATLVGAVLPFAVVLGVVGVPVWLLVRRVLRRRAARGPGASAPVAAAAGQEP